MNAGSKNEAANFAGSGLTPRSNVEFDLELLLQRPAAAEFHALSLSSHEPVDVFGFVHCKSAFTPQDSADALLLDQHQRHSTEAAIPAETYCVFLKNRVGKFSTETVPQDHRTAGNCTFLCPLQGHRSSRHQAINHHPDVQRRGETDGLWSRQARRQWRRDSF